MPVFRRYSELPQPNPDTFLSEYEGEAAKLAASAQLPSIQPLDADELKRILSMMKRDTAPGLDGWTVGDLKSLSKSCPQLLATLINEVDETGTWPRALSMAEVTLIPKACGPTDPGDKRPITVTSVAYRLWASSRLNHCVDWQAEYLP